MCLQVAVLSVSLSLRIQPGGAPSKAHWPGEHGFARPQSSVPSVLSSVASIYSSSLLLSLDGSSLPPNIDGITGQVHTFNASVRLDAIDRVMLACQRENGINMAYSDPEGFGHPGTMGLWDLHSSDTLSQAKNAAAQRLS